MHRFQSLFGLLLLLASACNDPPPETPPVCGAGSAASAEPPLCRPAAVGDTAVRSSLWLAQCTQLLAGPAISAGPYVLNVTSGRATVRFKTGAKPANEQVFSVHLLKSDGGCAESDVFEKGKTVTASLVEASHVPYVDPDADAVPSFLYSADFELEPSAEQARYCYGISLPPLLLPAGPANGVCWDVFRRSRDQARAFQLLCVR